jgi:L-ascorbate metabolism protein UlaG (beta-lactamase superfamily)
LVYLKDKKELRRMMIFSLTIFIVFVFVAAFLQQKKFGRKPEGERLAKIRLSPNYYNGSFQNLHHTPALTEGASMISIMKEFFFDRKKRIRPVDPIPSVKTDLLSLSNDRDVLVWFGHSSYFIQLDGKKILVDPVFSGSASPLPFGTKAFKGTDIYASEDMPEIDYLFITHDHWDHLDYKTILRLKPKIKKIVCSLGTAEHLVFWGFNENMIIEKDWYENISPEDGFVVYTMPARHFSGRGFKRNMTQWTSFVLKTTSYKIFIGGDSGYDKHFKNIGLDHGPFDLAILENGQYGRNWKYIHTLPGEFLQVASDLRAMRVLPVHSSKFALANHPWDEPLIKLTENNKHVGLPLATPMIGEIVDLKNPKQIFSEWWTGIH